MKQLKLFKHLRIGDRVGVIHRNKIAAKNYPGIRASGMVHKITKDGVWICTTPGWTLEIDDFYDFERFKIIPIDDHS